MTPTPKQLANLIPFNRMDTESAREIQSLGGKASARARRFNRIFETPLTEDIANTPLHPNQPWTDFERIHDYLPDGMSMLDKRVYQYTNFEIKNYLILEIFRQALEKNNSKALFWVSELILKIEKENEERHSEQSESTWLDKYTTAEKTEILTRLDGILDEIDGRHEHGQI